MAGMHFCSDSHEMKRKHFPSAVFKFPIVFNIPDLHYPPIILQPPEPPKETKEAKQTVAEVKVDTNGNQNGYPDEKKKLNKRERKEARRQKNGKSVKGADKTVAQEPEEDQAGKKKKKDRKRQRSCEEGGDDEQNGAETSRKKKKTSKAIYKGLHTMFCLSKRPHCCVYFCVLLLVVAQLCVF